MTDIPLFVNTAGTTLAAGISAGATTATLASGAGAQFPSPGAGQYFAATLVDSSTGFIREIVYVTSRTGDVVTMVRGQEGTTAVAWLAGDIFAALITAGTLNSLFAFTVPSQLVADLDMVGTITWSAYDEADGALKLVCDGRSLARTGTYARLFAKIGTTWGSVDGSHFNLPESRGMYLVGAQSGGVPTHDGVNVGQTVADQMQGFATPTYFNSGGGMQYPPNNHDRADPPTLIGPVDDGTHGTPRLGYTTRPNSIGGRFMIYY